MRADHRPRFGVPASPPHPLEFEEEIPSGEDSLQADQLSMSGPRHVEKGSTYELTFKKDHQQRYFVTRNKEDISRSLLSPSERQLVKAIREPLAYYYQITLQEMSSLPFADLYSLDLTDKDQKKLRLVGQILQVKRLHNKTRSVGLNYRCLKMKEEQSKEEKDKLYLLELLQKQLNKKYFIEMLRLNHMHKMFLKTFGEEVIDQNEENEYPSNPEQVSPLSNPHRVNEQLFGEDQQQVQQQREWAYGEEDRVEASFEQGHRDGSVDSQMGNQVLIFVQVVSAIVKKQVFSAFNTMISHARHSHRSQQSLSPLVAGDLSPIAGMRKQEYLIKSPTVLSNQHLYPQEPGSFSQHEEQQGDITARQQKLNELYLFIQQLHEECAQTPSTARKYFIKWKIYLLQAIAQSMISQLQQAQYGQPEEQEDVYNTWEEAIEEAMPERAKPLHPKHYRQNISQQEVQGPSMEYSWSRATSEISQTESTLKHQKKQLKLLIVSNRTKTFFNKLRDHYEDQQIKEVVDQVRDQKLIKNAFDAFKINWLEAQRIQNMEQFYEEIAENQEGDQSTAFYFWKTSQLHKYFSLLSQHRRNGKMERTLTKTTVALAFRTLHLCGRQNKKNGQTLERWHQYRQSKMLFKFFSLWKLNYRNTCRHFQKIKAYKLMKKHQLASHCFSILKLQYKKGLVKQLRADKFFKIQIKQKIFNSFKLLTAEGQDFRGKQDTLRHYLIFRRSNIFMTQFIRFYYDYIEFQRFAVKQQKLRRTIIGLHAFQGLKRWRASHMKKSAYNAIETRLVRLKQKQKKRQIFNLWFTRAIGGNHQSLMSGGSERHKEWLVQYYSGLCSVMPQS